MCTFLSITCNINITVQHHVHWISFRINKVLFYSILFYMWSPCPAPCTHNCRPSPVKTRKHMHVPQMSTHTHTHTRRHSYAHMCTYRISIITSSLEHRVIIKAGNPFEVCTPVQSAKVTTHGSAEGSCSGCVCVWGGGGVQLLFLVPGKPWPFLHMLIVFVMIRFDI